MPTRKHVEPRVRHERRAALADLQAAVDIGVAEDESHRQLDAASSASVNSFSGRGLPERIARFRWQNIARRQAGMSIGVRTTSR